VRRKKSSVAVKAKSLAARIIDARKLEGALHRYALGAFFFFPLSFFFPPVSFRHARRDSHSRTSLYIYINWYNIYIYIYIHTHFLFSFLSFFFFFFFFLLIRPRWLAELEI